MDTITLRKEEPADWREVENLVREAFWNQFAPGCVEHYLAHTLRNCEDFVTELDFIALSGGKIIGNIMYTKARIVLDAGGELPVLSFGPLAVLPTSQKQGIGGRLVMHTAALAREAGHSAILIYGDPGYYSHLGFVSAEHFGIGTADNLYRASLQAMELQPGALSDASGLFHESAAFDIDPVASVAFDSTFPPKPHEEGNPAQRKFHEILALVKPRH